MADPSISVSELEILCHTAAEKNLTEGNRYQPSGKQIFFFTLVWISKKKVVFQNSDDQLTGVEANVANEHIQWVKHHLSLWGEAVARLKLGAEREWVMLLEQMWKAVRRYDCSQDMKEDAYQDAQLKIIEILGKIPKPNLLAETEDIVKLVVDERDTFVNIYDFSSPIYNWAKLIASNELRMQLRQAQNEWEHYGISPPDNIKDVAERTPDPLNEDYENRQTAARLQLRIDLEKLFERINSLTPKQRQVVYHTVSARAQFWRACCVLKYTVPEEILLRPGMTTDADIAQELGINKNSVRVHRNNSRKQIQALDLMLVDLLNKFMNPTSGNAMPTSCLIVLSPIHNKYIRSCHGA